MNILRPLLVALAGLCLLAAAPAAASVAVISVPDPSAQRVDLVHEELVVRLNGALAQTTLTQVFHNPNHRDLEAVYILTLPRDAHITGLRLEIAGVAMDAAALDADEARRIYTDIVRQRKDPALLEYLDGRTFRVSVYPVPANQDVPVTVSWAEPLRREAGLFTHVIPGNGKGTSAAKTRRVTLEVAWPDELGPLHSPSHELRAERGPDGRTATAEFPDATGPEPIIIHVGSRQPGLGIHAAASRPRVGEDGTLLLLLRPPDQGAVDAAPRTVSFVVDVSGSMSAESRMDDAKGALLQALHGLRPQDAFNLVTFQTVAKSFADKPLAATAENLRDASEFVESLRPGGGTNVGAALELALGLPSANPVHQVFLVSDGEPTVGETSVDRLVELAATHNKDSLRLFTFGVGNAVNTRLLDELADANRGLAGYVRPGEDLEVAVSAVFEAVRAPALVSPKLTFSGAEVFEIYPPVLPDLFHGSDRIVLARYRGEGDVVVVLEGQADGKRVVHEQRITLPGRTESGVEGIEALWAQRKIAFLLGELRRNGESEELRAEIRALALKHNLPAPGVSLIAADDRDMQRVGLPGGMPAQDPRRGTVSRGDIQALSPASPSAGAAFGGGRGAAMSRAETGEAAVERSVVQNEMKSADRLVAAPAPRERLAAESRVLAGVELRLVDGCWTEQPERAQDEPTVEVEYLSDAYFALLDRREDRREAILAGERVALRLGGHWVVIGASGASKPEELPAGLR